MRAVLDTNVVVSGLFFGGVPRLVLEAWAEGQCELIVSPEIFDEYMRTCERIAETRPGLQYREVLLRLIGEGTLVPDSTPESTVSRDPDDDKFLLCARDSGALVVSGDQDLLAVSGWNEVDVVTPREFLDRLQGRG